MHYRVKEKAEEYIASYRNNEIGIRTLSEKIESLQLLCGFQGKKELAHMFRDAVTF